MIPTVSIVMAVRNPRDYIFQAIDSVFNQTFTDWELIVINDGSEQSIAELLSRYNNIRILNQDAFGVSSARNAGIGASKGKYIAFLDDDDVWFPDKLSAQVNLMENFPAIGLCYTERDVINAEGITVAQSEVLSDSLEARGRFLSAPEFLQNEVAVYSSETADHGSDAIEFVCTRLITTSTVMLRRNVLCFTGLFDTLLKYSEDYDMWIKCFMNTDFAHIRSSKAFYRWHGANTMSSYWNAIYYDREMFGKYEIYAFLTQNKRMLKALEKAKAGSNQLYAKKAFDWARDSFKRKKLNSGILHLYRAFLLDPRWVSRQLYKFVIRR